MKISSVQITQFRRFSELLISGIPQDAKLILLVGPNGSGKSSVFDAFNVLSSIHKTRGWQFSPRYHLKTSHFPHPSEADNVNVARRNISINFHDFESFPADNVSEQTRKAFYFRTAYRNESDFIA